MLVLSWPLWVESGSARFPRVPFVPRLAPLPVSLSWVAFAALLGSLAAATAGIAWRSCLGLGVGLLAALILGDQHRFQAWAYQFGMVALFLAALPDARALRLVRGWYIATYAYSGLSKLDVSFCRELGERFLETAGRLVSLDALRWPWTVRYAAILAMPLWEVAVAAALAWPA